MDSLILSGTSYVLLFRCFVVLVIASSSRRWQPPARAMTHRRRARPHRADRPGAARPVSVARSSSGPSRSSYARSAPRRRPPSPVRSQITGALTSVNFREGDDVTKGQVLFTLDRRPLEGALQQAEATLQRDTAQAGPGEIDRRALPGSAEPRASRRRNRPISRARPPRRSRRRSQSDRAAVENAKVQLQYATITRADFRPHRRA